MLVLGIDDAGRGPAIGPLVLGGVLIGKETEKILAEWGVKDSKQLTPKKRELLAEEIRKVAIDTHLSMFSAKQLNGLMQSGVNLNLIEAMGAANIINRLSKGRDEELKVIMDCPSTNIQDWLNKVYGFLDEETKKKKNLAFVCEHKADINHISVSAASILAKVKRDEEIELLKKEIGQEFGSGYPGDPDTKKFLTDYYEKYKHKEIFREEWETIKKLNGNSKKQSKSHEQKSLGEYEED